MTYKEHYDELKRLVEARLAGFFPGGGLNEAMRYSLMAGGKRLRPVLCLAFCEAAGGKAEAAIDLACAVEMLHTYSLIHDDLPCMDNDDLRRGKPTCHRVFGETAAVLAGDALQTAAIRTALGAEGFKDASTPLTAAKILCDAAGPEGMCLGQYWDTLGKNGPDGIEKLVEIDDKKTGCLWRAACTMGVAAAMGSAGSVPEGCMDAASRCATELGIAFQIRDDVLDVVSTTEALGKPVGSDRSLGKTTYVTIAGLEECERAVIERTERAKSALLSVDWPGGTDFLIELTDLLAKRST